ncbi:MAG: hypothetical protein A07HR67_01900, partial [uncultured archaeon A07HR67]
MRVREFSVALASPLRTAREAMTERTGFLVGVGPECDETTGATAGSGLGSAPGVGEATPLPGWTESFAACASTLADANGADPAGALADLDADETPAARHGLALALADAA